VSTVCKTFSLELLRGVVSNHRSQELFEGHAPEERGRGGVHGWKCHFDLVLLWTGCKLMKQWVLVNRLAIEGWLVRWEVHLRNDC
jgi:hypothetical protein